MSDDDRYPALTNREAGIPRLPGDPWEREIPAELPPYPEPTDAELLEEAQHDYERAQIRALTAWLRANGAPIRLPRYGQ